MKWRSGLSMLAALSLGCSSAEGGCGRSRAPLKEPTPSAGLRWQPPLEVARGNAHAGPWRMNESSFDYVDDPTVAFAEGGALAVAWVDNARKDVLFQRFDEGGRSQLAAPSDVSRSPQIFSWLPRLVVSGPRVFVLWQEIIFSGGSHGGDMLLSRSHDGGASFEAPLNLSRSLGGDGKGRLTREHWDNGSLALERAESGELLAAWTEYEGALWLSRSTDDGKTFSPPQQLGGSADLPARGPSLALATPSDVYIVWATGEAGSGALRWTRSRDGGRTFGEPAIALESTARLDAPKLAADARGTLHLAYTERPRDSSASRVCYARLAPGQATFESPRILTRPDSPGAFPSLGVAVNGHVAVAWHHQATADAPPRGIALALSPDGGSSFGAPELVPGTADPELGVNGSRQGKLMSLLSLDRSGSIAVAVSTFRAGDASRVRVVRGRQSHAF